MNIIVAADKNWGIGRNNELLVSIPADMKMFREETTGKVVVMGRKTLESFPNGLPLKNRTNIVITGNRDYQVKGAVVVHSIEEALKEVEKYPAEDVYCIGGDSIYKQMLPYCDTAHVTKIDFAYEADAYFPNLDEDPDVADKIYEADQIYSAERQYHDQDWMDDNAAIRIYFCYKIDGKIYGANLIGINGNLSKKEILDKIYDDYEFAKNSIIEMTDF